MTDLLDATLFTIPPDAGFPIRTRRSWRTDVLTPRKGKENRAALANAPLRRIEYTARRLDDVQLAEFRALWLAAAERLRFLVPLWPDSAEPSAIPDTHTITVDTTNRDFEAGGYALLTLLSPRDDVAELVCELVTIDTLDDGSITTADDFDAAWLTYPIGAVRVIPIMRAWMDPPTQDQLTSVAQDIPLAFTEEFTGVAGLDPDVGAGVVATAATVALVLDETGDGHDAKRFYTWTAFVFNAEGQEIPGAPIVWAVTATGDLPVDDPAVHISYPQGGRQIRLAYTGSVNATFRVDATSGAATTFSLAT